MHSKSNNIEIMIDDKADEVREELCHWLLYRYQIGQETSMRNSDFINDCVHLLNLKFPKINSNCGGLYIDSSDRIKNKKATFNPINKKINVFNTL